jgi:hypothetical protein
MRRFPRPARAPTSHPADVGLRSETAILATLVRLGYDVLVPHGSNHRYDFVVDAGSAFLRVQCKTGVERADTIVFRSQSVRSNTRETCRRLYIGEVDFFAVYSPVSDGVFMVPCDETTRGHTTLRLHATANNQTRGIRWAADYLLGPMPEEPERGLEPLRSRLQIGCSTN